MTPHEWFKLPLKLRQRWWKETNYGLYEPNEELQAAIIAAQQEGTMTNNGGEPKPADEPKPAEAPPAEEKPPVEESGDEGEAA